MSVSFQQLANFIWSVADLLRGTYRSPQYDRVMLLFTVLRRFDYLLAMLPFGVDWKAEKKIIDRWPDYCVYSRKLPRINDGAILRTSRSRKTSSAISCER